MKRAIGALVLLACADRTPPAATVSLALPLPSATTSSSSEPRDPKPALDDADFTSERGAVHLTAGPDGELAGTFGGDGVMTCKPEHGALSCRWYQNNEQGRATLRRKPDGPLEGTWGNGESADDGGAWILVPVPRAGPLDGVWDTNWGAATIRASARGIHVEYPRGTMDCEQHDRKLVCDWTESALTGTAELTIESSRVLRGHWTVSTEGGPWLFVRR